MSDPSAVPATTPTQPVSPRGRFFTNQTFHFETLRNAGYIFSQSADMGEILETTKLITEGDVQSWYTAWSATADLVLALAERTHDPRSKGGAYMRASTYQRTGEFLLPPDDPKRPEAFSKTSRYFFRGLDTLGVHYEYFAAPYENGSLRALYLPAPAGSEGKPVPRGVEHCPVADDEAHLLLIEPATPTTGDRSTAAQRIVI